MGLDVVAWAMVGRLMVGLALVGLAMGPWVFQSSVAKGLLSSQMASELLVPCFRICFLAEAQLGAGRGDQAEIVIESILVTTGSLRLWPEAAKDPCPGLSLPFMAHHITPAHAAQLGLSIPKPPGTSAHLLGRLKKISGLQWVTEPGTLPG